MDSVELAYFLYSYRWTFRIGAVILILIGSVSAFKATKWVPVVTILPVVAIIYAFNFRMTADKMFLQPRTLTFESKAGTTLDDSSIVIVVSSQGESKAYPIRYIQYHHQVRDTIAGKQIMVTYCNVCRTGRVFEPLVDNNPEHFRLVGMDHFNAMFEDQTTKSWWRQATGEAIAGPLKGKMLPEFESRQLTLGTFFSLHPFGKVMQAEDRSMESYDSLGRFEKGLSESNLTRTDSLSWKDKSWVVGIEINGKSKAYDWNYLKESSIILDQVGETSILIVITSDNQSFAAFRRNGDEEFSIQNDSLVSLQGKYDLGGRSVDGANLQPVKAYQEFWHSWKQFHPDTEVFDAQLRIFDVHLHGSRDPQTQLEKLTDAGVYKIAVSTSWDLQTQYKNDSKLKVLRGLMVPCPNGKVPYSLQACFNDGGEWPPRDWVEQQIKAGNIHFIGEVLSQYHGISSSDSTLLPYYRLAKKHNIPVGIHTGSAGPDHGCPNFKEALGNPLLLEPLLKKIPGLRVWIMHAGAPYLQEALYIMNKFPDVYADLSAINNPTILDQKQFETIVKLFVNRGLEDRIMFGSDNGNINATVESVLKLSFLTESQKEKIFYRNAERFFE